jgi:hypothetical protein
MDHGSASSARPSGAAAAGQGVAVAAAGDQRPALHQCRGREGARGAAVRAVRVDPDGPGPVQVRRGLLLSAQRRRDAPLFRELPAGVRQHLAHRRACARSPSWRRRGSTCPASPARRGRTRRPGSSRRSRPGCRRATPAGCRRVRKQAAYEIDIIVGKGYAGYFLVVADFINWAKDNGIRVGPGRGSGAGSMCAYAMRITDLDPLRHGLIFERFLNPERPSMPDFDVDFDERRRGEVIRYVTEKYGDDRVAQIVTYGTIKAKQAVKDAARVLGHPFAMGDRLTKAMPADVMGKGVPLKEIFNSRALPLRRRRRFPGDPRGRGAGPRNRRRRPSASRGSSGRPACTPRASSCPASR